ncbi:hypothetical protein EV363DRAFT_1328673 [Boletus edulis]|uniref:Uncharacterized protein n=1 Tax=Boletus edulis BED1 TaxID=1328754 RepID=A0AAD4BZH6_BOLED|nr:hypothetical protein EV363DRAFT_1328673 [Boletus edulis]KAF8443997.1 hypothetical protein L210DRAFT_3533420 [Boletus edulis BED1]
MKFSLSPLVLFAVLFTSAFALPIETALSKRSFIVSFGPITKSGVAPRDVHATVDDHLSKRSSAASDSDSISFTPTKRVTINLTLSGQIGGLKRDTEELSKRSEEYNVVVTSLPSPNSLSSRSTGPYDGHPVQINIPDNMVQDLQQMGVTEDQLPGYISKNMHVTDPKTGEAYTLVPNDESTVTASAVIYIYYQPL